MIIQFSSRNSRFLLDLRSRLTIIDDISGTGKTTLYDAIAVYGVRNRPVVDGHRLYAVRHISEIREENAVYVIDEGDEVIHDEYSMLVQKIQTMRAYFVIISRDNKYPELNTSVDDIVVLRNVKGCVRTVRKYPIPFYKMTTPMLQHCCVEDSTTGLSIIKKVDKNATSFYGKTKWRDVPSSSTIVLDRCGFGSEIRDFVQESSGRNLSVLDWESAEYTVLKYLGINIPSNDLCVNREEYYAQLLHQHLSQYGKTAECPCLHACKCSTCVGKDALYNSRDILTNLLEGKL